MTRQEFDAFIQQSIECRPEAREALEALHDQVRASKYNRHVIRHARSYVERMLAAVHDPEVFSQQVVPFRWLGEFISTMRTWMWILGLGGLALAAIGSAVIIASGSPG